jgi:hypothetical protein
MEIFSVMIPAIEFFNIAMAIGIVCFVIGIFVLTKQNKVLHEKNQRERKREKSRSAGIFSAEDSISIS